MTIAIPLSNDAGPRSRQIYLWFRKEILAGSLRPGERLPATRDLSEQLGVSRTVILLSYDQLLAEGFIAGRAGSGTYVADGLPIEPPKTTRDSAKLRLSRFGSYAESVAAGVHVPGKRVAQVRYDFAYSRTAVEDFPFEAWRRILMRRAREASTLTLDYGPSGGSLALREAIATHLRRFRAVVCDPSQVIVVNGSQQALDLTARVLLERGDMVVLEDPHYQGAREVFRAAGARLHPVAVDGEGLNPAKLPPQAKLAFVTPSHQFPTGTILPLSRRLALLEWAKQAQAVLVEDDYDGEFHYEGQPVESMQGLDREGRVIYIGTFSRTVFPALRIGYLIAPKSLVAAFTAAKWLCDRHTATLEQETLAEFISSGAYERYLRRTRRGNALRRGVLLQAVGEYFGDRVTLTGGGSGAHVVLWPAGAKTEASWIARAAAAGVGVYGLSRYYLGRRRKPGLLLGYSRLTPSAIRDGILRLSRV